MKTTTILAVIGFISIIGFSGCEKCDPCNCSTQLASGSSVNCKGTTQQGSGCNNMTLNACGYCYLHTDDCCE